LRNCISSKHDPRGLRRDTQREEAVRGRGRRAGAGAKEGGGWKEGGRRVIWGVRGRSRRGVVGFGKLDLEKLDLEKGARDEED
jgi:hypothetical protein